MKNLKRLRKAKGLTQKQLADLVDVTDSMISQLESGAKAPSFELALKIAEVLDCESSDLVTERTISPSLEANYVMFPIIGEVAAHYGHFGEENWTNGEIAIPEPWLRGRPREDFFVLSVSGESMHPLYKEGDLVLVLKQTTMDYSGQIGVVVYDDDKATLKRVEFVMGEDWMKLSPVNPQFPEKIIRGEKLEHCRVLGIPKMLIREIV